DPNRLKGDGALAAQRWQGPTIAAAPAALTPADIVIDALFGAGLDRPVEDIARAMIDAMNAAPCVHAGDLPSGSNGTTGAVMGLAVNATETVTFFRRKIGHVLLPGRLHCGNVRITDIGIATSVLDQIKPRISINAPDLWAKSFPLPRIEGHKYTRGHAVVVSGGVSRTAAARLAARGAWRAGAGLAPIATPREALAVNAAASLAVMVRPVDGADELASFLHDRRRNVVLLGPGGGVGQPGRDLVLAAVKGGRGVVLGAAALTSFADGAEARWAAIGTRGKATLMTRHEGAGRGSSVKAGTSPAGGAEERSGGPPQGAGHSCCGPGRTCRNCRQCTALARHRRLWRRACRHRGRLPRTRHAGIRGRGGGGLAAWRSGERGRSGADCGGPVRGHSRDLPATVQSARCWTVTRSQAA